MDNSIWYFLFVMLRWSVWICSSAPNSILQNSMRMLAMVWTSLLPRVWLSWAALRFCYEYATALLPLKIKPYLVTRSICTQLKRFIASLEGHKTIFSHKGSHVFESFVHPIVPTKCWVFRKATFVGNDWQYQEINTFIWVSRLLNL